MMKRRILHCILLGAASLSCTISQANETVSPALGDYPTQIAAAMTSVSEPVVSEKAWSLSQASRSSLLSAPIGETVSLTSFPFEAIRVAAASDGDELRLMVTSCV